MERTSPLGIPTAPHILYQRKRWPETGDTAISESDGRTKITLIQDVTDGIESAPPAHQRYRAVSRPSGTRRLAVVHRGQRIIEVRDRTKLPVEVRKIIDEASPDADMPA